MAFREAKLTQGHQLAPLFLLAVSTSDIILRHKISHLFVKNNLDAFKCYFTNIMLHRQLLKID